MQFIKATDKFCTLKEHIPAPIFRKTFSLDSGVEAAELEIAVSGFYELYVNGRNITRGLLAPYINNPDSIVYTERYDVREYLLAGKNAIAVILGNGFANQDVEGWEYSRASCRAPLKMALEMKITTERETVEITSDESFRVAPSPIIFDMYRYGVIYDRREEKDGFSLPDFDDGEWGFATLAAAPKGEILPNRAQPIRIRKELSAVHIERQSDFYCLHYKSGEPMRECYISDGYLFDFGVNTAGVCRLKIKGERGQKITVRHGERLRQGYFDIGTTVTVKDGTEKTVNYLQTDTYYLRGGEEEILFPPFTYHGFRYAFVEGITDEQAKRYLLTYAVFNTDVKKRSHFECSDEVLNKLYEMAIRADLSNFHHFPTDCPHREKNGWTGDIAVSSEQLLLSFGCGDNLTVWLESLKRAQLDSGMLPGIAPTTGWGYKWGNGPFWDQAAVVVPYYIYKYDGDTAAITENADMIAKYLTYVASRRDKDGLVAIGLGDWVQPKNREVGILSPLALTDSVTVYDIACKSEELFRVIGKSDFAELARTLKEEMRRSIKERLIDRESATALGSCQTSQALLLYFDLFDECDRAAAYRRLIEIIKADGERFTTGVIGLRYILEVLIRGGDCDLALKMISRPDEPSYASMIERGATALCESLDENGLNESENHHFLGDIIRVFISLIAGLKVNPTLTDVSSLVFSPTVPASLRYATAEYDFATGKAVCGWEKVGTRVRFYAEIPEGVNAKFTYGDIERPLNVGRNELVI